MDARRALIACVVSIAAPAIHDTFLRTTFFPSSEVAGCALSSILFHLMRSATDPVRKIVGEIDYHFAIPYESQPVIFLF